jgi:hypothetical protein
LFKRKKSTSIQMCDWKAWLVKIPSESVCESRKFRMQLELRLHHQFHRVWLKYSSIGIGSFIQQALSNSRMWKKKLLMKMRFDCCVSVLWKLWNVWFNRRCLNGKRTSRKRDMSVMEERSPPWTKNEKSNRNTTH